MRMKPTQWQEVIDLNLTGVFMCTQVSPGPPKSATIALRLAKQMISSAIVAVGTLRNAVAPFVTGQILVFSWRRAGVLYFVRL